MRVCHFTNGHDSFDGRVFHKQCRSLARAGYDVFLVAPDGVNKDVGGVKIRSVSVKFTNRFGRMVRIARAVYRQALSLDADIYHFHDPELIPYGLKLKRKGKKVIFDSHEDSPADISEKGWIPRPLRKIVAAIYDAYERRAVREFDALVTVTPHIVDRLKQNNPNTYLVTNYPILLAGEDGAEAGKREQVICFVGRINDEGMQKNILRAFENVEGARFLMAGTCKPTYLAELKKMPAWGKVDYIGEIAFSTSRDIFLRSLAGIQITDYIPNCGYTIGSLGNTKFFGYLEAGLPIICTDYLLWKEIVDTYKCGICVDPHDVGAISDAINYVVQHPDEARRMGENGRKAVWGKFNWSTQEKELLICYSRL